MYGGIFEQAGTEDEIKKIEAQTGAPDFWNNPENAEKTFQKLNLLKDSYYPWKEIIGEIDDLGELIELYKGEEDEYALLANSLALLILSSNADTFFS